MNTGVDKSNAVLTPASIVVDEPTTFRFDDQEYSPNNFEHEFYGRRRTRLRIKLQGSGTPREIPSVRLAIAPAERYGRS